MAQDDLSDMAAVLHQCMCSANVINSEFVGNHGFPIRTRDPSQYLLELRPGTHATTENANLVVVEILKIHRCSMTRPRPADHDPAERPKGVHALFKRRSADRLEH